MHEDWSDVPCTDCHHLKDGYCDFYKEYLDEIEPGVYIPCDACESDYDRSLEE